MPWIDFDSDGIAVSIYANSQRDGQDFVDTAPPAVGKYTWDGSAWNMALAPAKTAKRTELESAYASALCAGFSSDATGTAYIYCKSADPSGVLSAQADLIGAEAAARIAATANPSATVDFRVWNADGSRAVVAHTLDQIQQALIDGAARKQALVAALAQFEGEVVAATTVADVDAVTWTTPI